MVICRASDGVDVASCRESETSVWRLPQNSSGLCYGICTDFFPDRIPNALRTIFSVLTGSASFPLPFDVALVRVCLAPTCLTWRISSRRDGCI